MKCGKFYYRTVYALFLSTCFVLLVKNHWYDIDRSHNSEKMEQVYDIVIIGLGPTGIGALTRLAELQKMSFGNGKVSIIALEAGGKVGGLASSERDESGFLWDMGGHVLFSHYKYFNMALDSSVSDWGHFKRSAFAYMMDSDGKRKFISYPVQNNIDEMDSENKRRILFGLEEAYSLFSSEVNAKPTNFDEWLLKYFGKGLSDVFMRKFNRKVWTVNTTMMNSDWVGERVAVPDKKSARRKGHDTSWGPNSYFRFPRYNGTGGIWKAISDNLPKEWYRLNSEVISINTRKKTLTFRLNDSVIDIGYKTLITTAPLDQLVNMISDSEIASTASIMRKLAEQLVYSHTHVVGIGMSGRPPYALMDKSWLYFPDADSPFYRLTVFSSYSDDHVPIPGKYWSLMCEAAEPKEGNQTNWTKEKILRNTINALILYGFISENQIVSTYHRRLEHGYPVPMLSRENILSRIQPWLESMNIYSRGRFGGWRYEVSNQDHSFMQGVEIVDKILLNQEEETYPKPNLVNSRGTSSARLYKRYIPDIEFVISHYNESLDWLKPFARISHIYHKGQEDAAPFDVYKWKKLRNVGRESHTYLYHIINNYDELAGVTVFMHGHGIDEPLSYVSKAYAKGSHFFLTRKTTLGTRLIHSGPWLKQLRSGEMKPSKFGVGEYYKILFDESIPKTVMVSLKGCFSVTRKAILKRDKEFYKKVISFVNNHVNPEEGHYIERFWYKILNPV